MNGRDSVQSLLVLRKLTRAITDVVRVQMTEYLKTLTPLLRPKAVLGDYVQGGLKEPSRKIGQGVRGSAGALRDGRGGQAVQPAARADAAVELHQPHSRDHSARLLPRGAVGRRHAENQGRCPLTWVLTYTDFPPTRLQELLDAKARSVEELQRFVLNYLVMHLATTSDPGLMRVFEALHFPLTTSRVAAVRRAADHAHRHRHRDDPALRCAGDRERRADRDGRLRGGRQGRGHRPAGRSLEGRLLEIAREQAPELV